MPKGEFAEYLEHLEKLIVQAAGIPAHLLDPEVKNELHKKVIGTIQSDENIIRAIAARSSEPDSSECTEPTEEEPRGLPPAAVFEVPDGERMAQRLGVSWPDPSPEGIDGGGEHVHSEQVSPTTDSDYEYGPFYI